jgi:hypothetical protein
MIGHTCGSYPCAFLLHRGPWVRAGTRPSLRPLDLGGTCLPHHSGRQACENTDQCLALRCLKSHIGTTSFVGWVSEA